MLALDVARRGLRDHLQHAGAAGGEDELARELARLAGARRRSSSGGDAETVSVVDGPYRSSSLRPGAGANRTTRRTRPGATAVAGRSVCCGASLTSSLRGTGRTSRCAADSTTTSSPSTSTAPDGSCRPSASVLT